MTRPQNRSAPGYVGRYPTVSTRTRVPPLGSKAVRALDARVTGALIAVLGVVAGVVQIADPSTGAPDQVLGVLLPLVVGAALFAAAGRTPRWVLTLTVGAIAVVSSGTAVKHAIRGAGAGGTGGAATLVLIVPLVCAFRSRREAWLQLAWALAAFAVALSVEFGAEESAGSWVIQALVLVILTGAGTWTRRNFDVLLSELHHQADHDPLTGLLNRDGLQRHATRGLRRRGYVSADVDVTVFLLDIDHFKTINDSWGHPAGDEVLVWLSGLLRASIHPPESAARFGGEEFLIVLPDGDLAAGYDRAERLRQLVASASSSLRHPVTVSIGVACGSVSVPDGDLTHLYARADEALYRAKNTGRNRVEVAVNVPPMIPPPPSPPGAPPPPTSDRRSRPR